VGKKPKRALEIFDFCKKEGIGVRFLNDLGTGNVAVEAIMNMVTVLDAKKFKEKIIQGSSSKSSFYRDKDGFEFGVKEIRNNKLESLCKGCKENCKSNFME
jgi:hypothetical protein